MKLCRGILAAAVLITLLALQAQALEPMTYIYHPPESELDQRYTYQWEILREALEKTRDSYGPYLMRRSEVMTESRQVTELTNATGRLTVMYLDEMPEYERSLIPVRIPVDRGLVGYRILLIRKEMQPRFAKVASLADLRRYRCGLGSDWSDVTVFRANHLPVVTGSSYEGLFEMLVNRRFDYFSRGANEVLAEAAQRESTYPELAVEKTLVLHYPSPMYFWFPKTPQGERLAARAREGMLRMIADGSYQRIFRRHFSDTIARLRLSRRRVIYLDNPLQSPRTPLADRRLWFRPGEMGRERRSAR